MHNDTHPPPSTRNTAATTITTTTTTTAVPTFPSRVDVLVWSHADVDVLHCCDGAASRIEVVQAGQVIHTIPTTRQWQRERQRARRWAEAHLGLRGDDSLDGLTPRAAKRRLVILLTNSLDYLTNLSTDDLRRRYGRGAAQRSRNDLVRGLIAREERRFCRLGLADLHALWV
ncbi:MAG: hypothetical protein EI684_21410 [Candidatus Viridilinea halotolerans]|uniref:Uncharacterized protein n=1 Tax=Candidatus Viridilinea halotolerans TaxID=2491704 RepID=A0A426TRF0_9CHLR|nr:MAG: hypothetical protein EI684_21410 [Candidatus Viridilinea halotolerans]